MERSLWWGRDPEELAPGSEAWPVELNDLGEGAPARLWVAGRVPPLEGAVAIVGTRYADAEGLGFARELARGLAAAGHVIVSGGAIGIDTEAHVGALEGGGFTVAVLATGLRRPYPASNRRLFVQIAERGAVVTEHDGAGAVRRHSFLARNRLIAALAEVVVVVQAPSRSGALSTAALAVKLKRPVFAVPYAPWDPRGEGCTALLRRGANICTSTRDILSLPLRRPRGAAPCLPGLEEEALCYEPWDQDCRAVMAELSQTRPKHPDELTIALGLHILRVRQALTQLQLMGFVTEVGPGKFAKGSGSKQR